MKTFGPFLAVALLVLSGMTLMEDPIVGSDDEMLTRANETWTILSYLAADSNLESELISDLNEMELVPSSPDLNMVVQIDRRVDFDSSNGDWKDTRRYLVKHDETSEIASTRIDDPELGEKNMNDPWTLKEFLTWGLSNYPADHYMITLHGHASGPATGLLDDDSSTLGGPKRMNTEDMGWAIRTAIDETIDHPVDVISLDVCWMGMLEVAMEVMNHSDHFIGSFDQIPAAGWPYDKCIPLLIDDSKPIDQRLESIVDKVIDDYAAKFSYVSLFALDLQAVRDDLVPAFETFSEEMFYSTFDERELYDSLLESVDKPSGKEGRVTNDRYIELYQFVQYLSQDPRTPPRVRSAAKEILDTENDVIIHRRAGADHPSESRLMGIYFPIDMDDPDYGNLMIGQTTAWDDTARFYVREMDARPEPLNWTQEKPTSLTFSLRTSNPETIMDVKVEVISGSDRVNLTLEGSGGFFSGTYQTGAGMEIEYRFRVYSVYGGVVDFPPDGYSSIKFESESLPPEVWHEPPAVITLGPTSGGLVFYIRDSTGIETKRIESVPRLEYREKGKTSWYSRPLVQGDGKGFNGWIIFSETPSGMTPGSRIEYRIVVEDVLANSATYPSSGFWESMMGVGARFFLDGRHSALNDHDMLIREFNELGMVVDIGLEDDGVEELSSYKGYILIDPDEPIPPDRIEAIIDFIEQGGEFLLLIDPTDGQQISFTSLLLQELDVEPTLDGVVNGFYPVNSFSELGGSLPTISGISSGSFEVSQGQTVIYYTIPPLASMYSDWYGYGRIIVSTPSLLDDAVMGRDANRQLADRVIGYLHENMLPHVEVDMTPAGVVMPGQAVSFDLSGSYDPDGVIVQYSLSLSDNTYLEGPDPSFKHTFETTGVFTVLLKAYDEEGEVGSRTVTVKVNRPPTADIGISSVKVYAGEQVTFTYKGRDPDGDEITAEWDFGDGFKVSGLLVRHTYNRRGEFTYRVVVRDINGLESERSGLMTVMNSQPSALIDRENIFVNGALANFSGELMVTVYVMEGDTVRIPGDLSFDPDQNDFLNFTWDMGDGSMIYDQIVVHRFKTSGLIRVNLTVDDGFGGVDSNELFISVENRAPFAAFEHKEKSGKVTFDASLSTDDPWDMDGLRYKWDFGDGKTRVTTEPMVEHDYTFGGDYRVKLTVIDGDNAKNTFEQDISASGIGLWMAILLIISILAVLGVLGYVGWRKLKERMLREDKGLLEILGFKAVTEPAEDDHPGSFKRPVRTERLRPGNKDKTETTEDRIQKRTDREALPPRPARPRPRKRDRGGDD